MLFSIDYSATDATFWRAVITTGGGARVAAFEVRKVQGITRGVALRAMALMIRALRPQLDADDYLPLIRASEREADNG